MGNLSGRATTKRRYHPRRQKDVRGAGLLLLQEINGLVIGTQYGDHVGLWQRKLSRRIHLWRGIGLHEHGPRAVSKSRSNENGTNPKLRSVSLQFLEWFGETLLVLC